MIDLPVRSVTGGEEPLALALAFLQPEDVVVGISFRRDPRDVVNAIQEARAVGAQSIGITDSELSPVNEEAFWDLEGYQTYKVTMSNNMLGRRPQ